MMNPMRSIPSTTAPKPFPMQITKNWWLWGIYHKLHGLWMRLPPLLFMLDLIAKLLSYARQVHRLTHRRRIVRLNGLINIFRKRNVKSSLLAINSVEPGRVERWNILSCKNMRRWEKIFQSAEIDYVKSIMNSKHPRWRRETMKRKIT